MAYNKVEANGETLIDLTSDTVTADTLVSGRTAHLASGEKVSGTFEPVTGVKGNAETAYRTGNVNLTPANIGLGNVNNTSDLDKPISTAAQAELDSQQAQIDKALEQTGYNMLEITEDTTTRNGITFTIDKANGTITVNGTPTQEYVSFTFYSNNEINGKYYISGCPVNGSGTTYNIRIGNYDNTFKGNEFGKGFICDINAGVKLTIHIYQAVSNIVFKPMIVPAELAGVPFQPYAKSNAELTQDLDDISGELDCLTIRAALVNNEVVIQNTSDFTNELYSKYFSYTKPKFAILKLQITSNTHYYKALINSLSVSQGNLMEASFTTLATGEYIYNFTWLRTATVGTPTVIRKALNLGS